MSDELKAAPDARPSSTQDLQARVARDERGDDDGPPLRIRLEVSGGTAGEHYRLAFTAHQSGQIEARLHDELRKIDAEARQAEEDAGQVKRLFGSVDVARLAEAARMRQPIPPCSLVGQLTVTDGRQSVTVFYMADPGQAEEAGFRIHPAVRAVVGEIDTILSRQLGLDNRSK